MRFRFFFAAVLLPGLATAPLLCQNPSAPGSGSLQDAGPAPQESPLGARQRRPLPKPTNLKVLPKDIAPQDLVKIMRGYAAALGVECNFCHSANAQTHKLDFASDAKDDKGIARTMILMTRTINEQFMSQVHDPDAMPADKHVTCGTCHRGHSMPEHFVPPPDEHHRQPGGTDNDHAPQ